MRCSPLFARRALIAILLAVPVLPAPSVAQVESSGPKGSGVQVVPKEEMLRPKEELKVFPYQLVDYTREAHETRIQNAPVIAVGKVESYEEIAGTEKNRNWSIWLRVETLLRTDRMGQEQSDRLYFRLLPPLPPHQPIKVGDRCLVLLDRDLRYDNALILPTEMNYYPVSAEGVVSKFWKDAPTREAPTIREQALSAFLEEIRALLRAVSLEEQARACGLVLTGTVTDSRQGEEGANDFYFVQVKPEKVFKGQPEGDTVTFIQRGNPYRWAVQAMNRAAFKKGDRVLCFGNKDPTFSKPGAWNRKGEPLYVFPYEKNSSLFLAGDTAWRSGFQPIPLDELYAQLTRWTKAAQ
ncbi:hypothetical protein FJ251_01425 [bacterium]|nr:hypothetical protein [bacterium]